MEDIYFVVANHGRYQCYLFCYFFIHLNQITSFPMYNKNSYHKNITIKDHSIVSHGLSNSFDCQRFLWQDLGMKLLNTIDCTCML